MTKSSRIALALSLVIFVQSSAHAQSQFIPLKTKQASQNWSQESIDLPGDPHFQMPFESTEPWGSDTHGMVSPWEAFIQSIPNTKSILWGLSWDSKEPFEKNSDKAMIPASVLKVLTTATALRVLGSDYRFTNSFQANIDTLNHVATQVEFAVSGDPTWGHPAYGEGLNTRVQKAVKELVAKGVTKVVGPISIRSLSPQLAEVSRPTQWKPSWLLACYATIPTVVTLNGNCATLKVSTSTTAKWLTAGVSTPVDVKLKAAWRTAPSVNPVLDSYGRVEKYEIRGTFAAPTLFSLPVHNNEEWLKNLFKLNLKQSGIAYEEVKSAKTTVGATNESAYVDLSSKTLIEILPVFLQESVNLVGDRLYLEASYRLGSAKSDEPQLQTLVDLLHDVNATAGVVVNDGSGLIPDNRISANVLKRLLTEMKSQPYFDLFLNALPIAGKSGTLKTRLTGPTTVGKIFAKTGTIDGVVNLAGYYKMADSSFEPFVILTQSSLGASSVRAAADKIVVEFVRKNTALRRR